MLSAEAWPTSPQKGQRRQERPKSGAEVAFCIVLYRNAFLKCTILDDYFRCKEFVLSCRRVVSQRWRVALRTTCEKRETLELGNFAASRPC